MHLNTVIVTLGFSAQQMREIYELAQEGQWLGAKFTKDFTELSSQEALASKCLTITLLTTSSCTLRAMMNVRGQ